MAHSENCTPPRAKFTENGLSIPPTPFLNCLGYGTGVNVWSFSNSCAQSPWAVKNVRKSMDDAQRAKYQTLIDREASVLSDLKHENIIGYRALLEAVDGRHCLAMESCGRSLGDMIEERAVYNKQPFSPQSIFKVVRDVAKALSYLHNEKKLLHGDIKSYNILVKDDFEVVKLCDLGVYVKLNSEGVTENYAGTLIYNAPEVINESEDLVPITAKAEIFSLGLVIWEMLALKPPHCDGFEDSMANSDFDLDGSQASMFSEGTLGSRPELPENLGPQYDQIVDIFYACTEAIPNERISAVQLAEWELKL